MVTPPKKWEYILIELEIDGKVIDSRIASHSTFEGFYKHLLRIGQLQTLPWALFISKSNYLKPRVYLDNRWQLRNKNGRFIKAETKPILYEDERP